MTLRLPYDKGSIVELLHKEASVVRIDYLDDCIEIEAVLNPDTYGRLRDYESVERG